MAITTSALAALALSHAMQGKSSKRKRGRPAKPRHSTLLTGPAPKPKRPRGKPARYGAAFMVWYLGELDELKTRALREDGKSLSDAAAIRRHAMEYYRSWLRDNPWKGKPKA